MVGSRSPVAAVSRLRSSTAVSESKPSSLNVLSASTAPASPSRSTAAAWPCTSVRSSWSVSRSGPAPPGTASTGTASTAAGPVPAGRATGASTRSPETQYASRWNAYVGSGTRRPPATSGRQSTATPLVASSAADSRNRRAWSSCRRSVPCTTAPSTVSWMAVVSTGCGLTSTKIRCPAPASTPTVSAKRTGSRRLRYQ